MYHFSYNEKTFHSDLLNKYSSIMEKIGQLIPQEKVIDDLGITLMMNEEVPIEEKDKHLTFLTHLSRINEEIQIHYWMTEHLKVLHEFGNIISNTLSKQEIYTKAFELVGRVMDADAFFIAMYEPEDDTIVFPFLIEAGVRLDPVSLKYGEGIVSKVIATRETLHLKTSNEIDSLGAITVGENEVNINSSIYIPLLLGDQVKGVISAQSMHQFIYKKEHVELLKIIGNQVVNAVENTIMYQTIYERSIRDDLTNLLNRRAFNKDLDERIKQANATGEAVVLIMLDSDNLKTVNDLYGHHVGDIYIKHVAKTLVRFCSERAIAYRYAGDEFMILASGITIDQALEKVKFIQNYLRDNPIDLLGNSLPVTVSVGISAYPEHAKDAEELKRLADEALYLSKECGKNGVNISTKKCI